MPAELYKICNARRMSVLRDYLAERRNQISQISKMVVLIAILMVGVIFACDTFISNYSKSLTYDSVTEVPSNRVGLILGTSKFVKSGKKNLYFHYRIDAAVELYRAGKIKYIIVSGDNSSRYYNEPRDMRAALMKRGVPSERIIMDFAGFRTLDSVVRAKEIFNQQEITIISQKFQNERAVYIAKHKGISAVAYNAKNVSFRSHLQTHLREYLARVKVMLDLYVLNVQPKYLGRKIYI
ncbi:ElyC/SanA/YdcF family protein [Limibacter armeniacum]|uniref:SanA/YdcF family protein n=1 Tax=Limibacter armeniacum TaxID=466084 RepID=UPI002FE55612